MAFTFLDAQNFLSQLLGDSNQSSEDMWPSAQRLSALNSAEVQFARDARNLRELATGTISNSELALPSDWIRTYLLIVDNQVLNANREIAISDWERYVNYSGTPPYYYMWEISGVRTLKFLGSGTNYKLYYFKKPTTALVNNTDTSIHPEEYRKGPVYFAASELLMQIGKHQESNIMMQHYSEYVARAIADVGETYIDKNYASPDFGDVDINSTGDRQGQGYNGWVT